MVLNETVEATKQVSPNPAKQQRRTVKSQKRKLDKRRDKMREHQAQQAIYGQRNSYSKRITMPPLCGSRKIRCKTVN